MVCSTAFIYYGVWCQTHVVWISQILYVGFVSKHQHESFPVRAWCPGQETQTSRDAG